MSSADFDPLLAASRRAPVVPVLTVGGEMTGRQIAGALVRGRLSLAEVTLRRPDAIEALRAMKAAQPDLIIGAGTVISPADLERVVEAGADFVVTPGTTAALRTALADAPVPVIPGVATLSEAMTALEAGFSYQKFFPAGAMGGVETLKAFAGPLPQVSFMPTGGVNEGNLHEFLGLSNVFAAGGTWIAREHHVQAGDWPSITKRARAALNAARY